MKHYNVEGVFHLGMRPTLGRMARRGVMSRIAKYNLALPPS